MTGLNTLARRALVLALAAAPLALAAGPALAHHGMHGEQPSTPAEGFVTGLAHPVLGLDHLAVLIGVGLLAARFRKGLSLPAVFIVAMAGGCALHLTRLDLPFVEVWVALSIIAVGLAAALRPATPLPLAIGLFGLGGLVHGYALAESMVGAETGAVWAYLIGLALTQSVVATAALLASRWVAVRRQIVNRIVAGLVAASGAAFLLLVAAA
ncbi:HupE/UreJ family protein [Caulobacter mirabilis]|uniref:Urease accessory protein UreJ n=1 Tax=Caulobacter mirabilis TaxID=69666 RepID=A0A2D2AY43_9CAUL|nr:HupE/UreJ family protein [Caulobacter mirabilis]ATQ42936.1 urease accessory protein UreJ [Caulobacter mirabilis]